MPRKVSETHVDAATQAVDTEEQAKTTTTVVEEAVETIETVYEASTEAAHAVPAAIRQGANDARRAVADFLPAIGATFRKGVYNGFYYGSYGVVFGALVISHLVPQNNAMGAGIRDGATAARDDFQAHERAVHEKPIELI